MGIHHLLISIGLLFMTASIYQSHKLRHLAPMPQRKRWLLLEGLMVFFLIGYAMELISSARVFLGPFQYMVSFVYLGGAVFVFTTIKMSQVTIRHLKRNEDRISHLLAELQEAYDSTIEGWGHALELRDKETEGHTKRVCAMTMALAARFSFTAEELRYIRFGALLHDIGKMGVPDSILLNDGALNDDEKAIMKRHPDYAKEMLAGIDFLKPALDIPYCHHERWDGSGYPQGLKGEAIPLAARIFTVADVWDALSNERRYHEAWHSEQICEYIRCRSGTHFDPQVVAKFLELDLCTMELDSCALEPNNARKLTPKSR
ncbi:MAG: HD domain-containing protein [Desulfobulbaceae bacterium]|nr:HD domain-containing protein [Desulfobulbaceae bacterium]